jgi:hypothetical protein
MRVGGARPPPFITFTITSKVAVYALAERADTLTLFHLFKDMYSVTWTVDILFKEDVTIILPLGLSFMNLVKLTKDDF